jgi:2-oxoglutarate dehydrogenase E2 component (dihydrolipoamide succinyltransferase)
LSQEIKILMPSSEQEGTTSVIGRWLKSEGESVTLHEPVLEILTDKVTIEVSAPASGVLKKILMQADESVNAGDALGVIEQGALKSESVASTQDTKELSPAVKKLLKEHNLSPSSVTGTGRGGRITHEDVLNFLARNESSSSRRVPHSQMRKNIAKHMVESALKTSPHVTALFDVDLSAVVSHREKHKQEFEAKGVKLTITSYFIQATCKAISKVPEVNSRFHESDLEIFSDCNIGIATALQDGLIVPVLHKAEKLDLFSTAEKLQLIIEKARDGDLGPKDVTGGTFTITNHGVSGSLFATPIINQPQVAILGVGKIEKRAVVVDVNGVEQIQIRPKVYITLTIDHRALDGFQANSFLSALVEVLENWS